MEYNRKTTDGQVTGIIGIVLGVISLIVAFIPCIGVVAFFPGGLAIIFSVISILQATRGNGAKSLGIISLVISFLAILLAAAWLILFSGVSFIANEAMKDPDKLEIFEKRLKDALKNDTEDKPKHARLDTLENILRELEVDTAKREVKIDIEED
jgi:hypothetical protein